MINKGLIVFSLLCLGFYSKSFGNSDSAWVSKDFKINGSLELVFDSATSTNWINLAEKPMMLEIQCPYEQKDSGFYAKIYNRSGVMYLERKGNLFLFKCLLGNKANSVTTPKGVISSSTSIKRFEQLFPELISTKYSPPKRSEIHYYFFSDPDENWDWYLVFSEGKAIELYCKPNCE
jgi:hypothetical protein